jgi:hypothetical protein
VDAGNSWLKASISEQRFAVAPEQEATMVVADHDDGYPAVLDG